MLLNESNRVFSTKLILESSMKYEVEGSRPRGRLKRTWREVVQKDCQARKLNREDVMDCSRWKMLTKAG